MRRKLLRIVRIVGFLLVLTQVLGVSVSVVMGDYSLETGKWELSLLLTLIGITWLYLGKREKEAKA